MRKRKAASFCNERTIEYALIEPLQRALRPRFESVSFLFFWSTREGTAGSTNLHRGLDVYTLAVFARRPKILDAGVVLGKVNATLVDFAGDAIEYGVPTIAALPVCSNIPDLFKLPPVVWLNVNKIERETVFLVDVRDRGMRLVAETGEALACLAATDIADLVSSSARAMTWSDSMDLMRSLRRSTSPSLAWFGILNGYRPVYVQCQGPRARD